MTVKEGKKEGREGRKKEGKREERREEREGGKREEEKRKEKGDCVIQPSCFIIEVLLQHNLRQDSLRSKS